MKILVLEDSISRINCFIEKFSAHDLVITESADSAVEYLEKEVFDCMFLDHDLGVGNGCGADVVVYLCNNSLNLNNDAVIIIHSWNMPAAKSMKQLKPNIMIIPFGSSEFYEIRS